MSNFELLMNRLFYKKLFFCFVSLTFFEERSEATVSWGIVFLQIEYTKLHLSLLAHSYASPEDGQCTSNSDASTRPK